jgi:hypothetical protein
MSAGEKREKRKHAAQHRERCEGEHSGREEDVSSWTFDTWPIREVGRGERPHEGP